MIFFIETIGGSWANTVFFKLGDAFPIPAPFYYLRLVRLPSMVLLPLAYLTELVEQKDPPVKSRDEESECLDILIDR